MEKRADGVPMPSESVTTFCAEQTGVARRLTALERNLVERGPTKVTKRRRALVHDGEVGMLVRPVMPVSGRFKRCTGFESEAVISRGGSGDEMIFPKRVTARF